MSRFIHPTAIVEEGAHIAEGVHIGPFCTVGPHVSIGAHTKLVSHVVIAGRTTLGEHNTVYPFASLGQRPQDLKYKGEDAALVIGDNNQIRESVTMHIGTTDGGSLTTVGNDNLFMALCHVAHDCIIGSHCVFANGATLAGHVEVGDYAIIGGLGAVHQFVRIGAHAMVGAYTPVSHDIPPYSMVTGSNRDAVVHGLNLVGLRRRGFTKTDISALDAAFEALSKTEGKSTMAERIATVESSAREAYVQDLCTFLKTSKRGVTQFAAD